MPLVNLFTGLPAGVTAGWTTRHGGVSRGNYQSLNFGAHVGDDPNDVAENRSRLATALGAAGVVWLNQVHGAAVVAIDSAKARSYEADAAHTAVPNLALAIMSADCVPVVVAARDASCVGVAHAGWQGLQKGVIDSLLDALPGRSARAKYLAWVGPCIRSEHYPVGAEVWSRFADRYPQHLYSADDDDSKRRLNLAGIAATQLSERGVPVVDCGACTYASDDFFSYRRARHQGRPETGRSAAVVMLGDGGR